MKTIYFLLLEYALIAKLKIRSYLIRTPPSDWSQGGKGNVLLINGWTETWAFFLEIGDFANSLGYRVDVPEGVGRNREDIFVIAEKIESYIIEEDLTDIVIICHSRGGYPAKLLLNDQEINKRIKKVIAVTVPFHGTKWRSLRIGNLSSMIPDQVTLQKLRLDKDNEKIISVRVSFDNHIIPFDSPILPGAENIEIPMVGHTRVLQSKELKDIIKKALIG